MFGGYTEEASEHIEALVETDIAEIWADIEEPGATPSAEQWKAKLKSIAQEYLISSRFALMRILHNRVLSHVKNSTIPGNKQKGSIFADNDCFTIQVGQDWITFSDISVEHSQALSPAEHMHYLLYLLEIAGPSPEEDPDLHERIISRAWHDEDAANALMVKFLPQRITENPRRLEKAKAKIAKENAKRFGTIFTREEALQLGHILKFTLAEMQTYLMRVFDVDDGLRMNHSADLIEAYGFKIGASCLRVAQLKQKYQEISSGIEKKDDFDRSKNWTQRTSGELLENIESWMRYPDSMDDNFLIWLKNHAAGFDIPSRTARRIYRNLAIFSYKCSIGKSLIPAEEEVLGVLQQIMDLDEDSTDVRFYLYEDGTICPKKCQDIAKLLYLENKQISNPDVKDNTLAWSVITTRKDGELSASYGAVNSSRTRIQSLLMGNEDVEKGDLLYLLWFTLNLSWADSPADDPEIMYCRIFDLKDASAPLLEKALLPPFYPPHLMEQSMLLSIIYGGKIGTDPAIIYGSLLESVKESRVRESGSNKHTLQEKIDIVNQYRNGMTLKQCAALYGISEKTLSQWQKDLIKQGYIDTSKTPEQAFCENL